MKAAGKVGITNCTMHFLLGCILICVPPYEYANKVSLLLMGNVLYLACINFSNVRQLLITAVSTVSKE